ncbi:PREDICTED: uncharacterized protein LOC109338843 [Lupinus angustifolius]|uniref:uncharacterized protein LOC109338843 n=1 Tax=Lupinus angustifolius TaxID=3871 RepID=UPI00092E2263|nr:PREDICTED: uncharacterized protein LOC109338843 [Lupinus angustifolius]
MEALEMEEEFWKEKSRLKLHSIIPSMVIDFEKWKRSFSSNNICFPNSLMHRVIPSMEIDSENAMLTTIPANEEIKAVVFSMSGEGALGPDGFGGLLLYLQGLSLHDKDDSSRIGTFMIVYALLLRISINVKGQNFGFFSCKRGDILSFCRGIKRELTELKKLIIDYALASGRQISPNKCKFYTRKTINRKNGKLSNHLGFYAVYFPFTYLGVPFFKGKPRKRHLQPIVDKIILKLETWKGISFSIIGRVDMVKSVYQSMLIYIFKIYAWPSQLLTYLDTCFINFIWSGDIKVRKLVTVSWSQVCNRTSLGCLGVKSIKKLNRAAILKLNWEMKSSHQDWANFCRERFNNYSRYYKYSIWLRIKSNWHVVFNNYTWLIGDGRDTNFWKDNWLSLPLTQALNIPEELHHIRMASVADFLSNSKWIIPKRLAELFPHIAEEITSTIVSLGNDKLIWNQSRFQDKNLNRMQAISRINLAISQSNRNSSTCSNNSIHDFNILKQFNVSINYRKAPRISEVLRHPPKIGFIKINLDGATHGASGLARGGAIFRDHMGDFMACFASFFVIQDTLFAELISAILAIEFAYKKRWYSIWLECDSSLSVDIFMG